MDQQTVTLAVSGFGILGTLTAAFGSHFLTRSWQQRQWVLNSRKEEARELLSAIAEHHNALLRFLDGPIERMRTPVGDRKLRAHEIEESQSKALRTIRDRIFLADEVREHRLLERWVDAFVEYEKTMLPSEFTKRYEEIRAILVKALIGR